MTVPGNGDFFLGHSNESNGDGYSSDKLRGVDADTGTFLLAGFRIVNDDFFLEKF